MDRGNSRGTSLFFNANDVEQHMVDEAVRESTHDTDKRRRGRSRRLTRQQPQQASVASEESSEPKRHRQRQRRNKQRTKKQVSGDDSSVAKSDTSNRSSHSSDAAFGKNKRAGGPKKARDSNKAQHAKAKRGKGKPTADDVVDTNSFLVAPKIRNLVRFRVSYEPEISAKAKRLSKRLLCAARERLEVDCDIPRGSLNRVSFFDVDNPALLVARDGEFKVLEGDYEYEITLRRPRGATEATQGENDSKQNEEESLPRLVSLHFADVISFADLPIRSQKRIVERSIEQRLRDANFVALHNCFLPPDREPIIMAKEQMRIQRCVQLDTMHIPRDRVVFSEDEREIEEITRDQSHVIVATVRPTYKVFEKDTLGAKYLAIERDVRDNKSLSPRDKKREVLRRMRLLVKDRRALVEYSGRIERLSGVEEKISHKSKQEFSSKGRGPREMTYAEYFAKRYGYRCFNKQDKHMVSVLDARGRRSYFPPSALHLTASFDNKSRSMRSVMNELRAKPYKDAAEVKAVVRKVRGSSLLLVSESDAPVRIRLRKIDLQKRHFFEHIPPRSRSTSPESAKKIQPMKLMRMKSDSGAYATDCEPMTDEKFRFVALLPSKRFDENAEKLQRKIARVSSLLLLQCVQYDIAHATSERDGDEYLDSLLSQTRAKFADGDDTRVALLVVLPSAKLSQYAQRNSLFKARLTERIRDRLDGVWCQQFALQENALGSRLNKVLADLMAKGAVVRYGFAPCVRGGVNSVIVGLSLFKNKNTSARSVYCYDTVSHRVLNEVATHDSDVLEFDERSVMQVARFVGKFNPNCGTVFVLRGTDQHAIHTTEVRLLKEKLRAHAPNAKLVFVRASFGSLRFWRPETEHFVDDGVAVPGIEPRTDVQVSTALMLNGKLSEYAVEYDDNDDTAKTSEQDLESLLYALAHLRYPTYRSVQLPAPLFTALRYATQYAEHRNLLGLGNDD
ncbi:MAG: hypothetical protein MHM6MM_002863 [Cercozoa sp. M6MM]